MTKQKWVLVVGIIAVVAALLALGTSPGNLLLLGAALLCPAAMYFGMSGMGMQQGGGHSERCDHSDAPDANRKAEGHERQKAA